MNRRKFLERLGIGTVAAVAAPLAIAEALKGESNVVNNLIPHGGNTPHIMKDTFEVTGSTSQNIKWVKHGDNYLWYNQTELETRRLYEEQMERLLLQHGKQSLSSFLSKMGKTV